MPTITPLSLPHRPALQRSLALAGAASRFRALLALLRTWRDNRADRHRLQDCLRLDPRLAKDIGLTPSDIEMEDQGSD